MNIFGVNYNCWCNKNTLETEGRKQREEIKNEVVVTCHDVLYSEIAATRNNWREDDFKFKQ